MPKAQPKHICAFVEQAPELTVTLDTRGARLLWKVLATTNETRAYTETSDLFMHLGNFIGENPTCP